MSPVKSPKKPENSNEKAIIVFVKNPDHGTVKTRLAADIGPEKAMDTYLRMVALTMDQARAADAHVHVFFSREVPATWPGFEDSDRNATASSKAASSKAASSNANETGSSKKAFATEKIEQRTSSRSPFRGTIKHVQEGDDLGERMNNAFLKLFQQNYNQLIIIGSDCPGLRTHHLNKALDALKSHDAVIGPARDGGYYLLGTNTFCPYLFQNKRWSTSSVFRETVADLTQRGARVHRLPVLQDLDTLNDLLELNPLIRD